MNQEQINLLITHLPILGIMIGFVVLTYGIWHNSYRTPISAYLVFIISSIGAAFVYFKGEVAQESIVETQGITEKLIKQPESYTLLVFVSLLILGLISIVAYLVATLNRSLSENISFIVLIISLLSLEIILWTSVIIGTIEHPQTTASPPKNLADVFEDYE